MQEMLKDVLIKEVTPRGVDVVIVVDNLPKSLLYRTVKKMMIDYTDPRNQQNLVPAFEVLDNGIKRRTNEMTDELLPGIELSDNEPNCFIFYADYNSSREALAAVDRYISASVPVAERVPERVPYAAQPGNHNSAPLQRHQIPRVVLPELVSPPVLATAQVPAPRALGEEHIPHIPANRQIKTDEEVLKEKRDRMAKARAAKAVKQDK